MKRKKKVGMLLAAGVLAALAIFLLRGRKQVLLDERDSRVLNSTFWVADPSHMDRTLQRKQYAYTTDMNSENIAVILYQSHRASMRQYLLKHGQTKVLTVPRDSELVISMPINFFTGYAWDVEGRNDEKALKLERRSTISIPYRPRVPESGTAYGRQNFYFTPLKTGTQQIRFVCQYEKSAAGSKLLKAQFPITISVRVQP